MDWGWVLQRTGYTRRGLELTEQALEIGQGQDRPRSVASCTHGGGVTMRRGSQADLELYEQALPLMREVGNRAGEATTLSNMAGVYDATGQPRRALELYEQALPLMREVETRRARRPR